MKSHQIPQQAVILVCANDDCRKNGCKKVQEALKKEIKRAAIGDAVHIQRSGCLSHCKLGPNVMAFPTGRVYNKVKARDAEQIVNELRGVL